MPSRPLSADRTLEVRLHTRAGTLASAVARGVTTRGQAVAALSLIAPCRPELTERVLARIGSIPSPNPQTVAALGDGDAGAPVALGMIGLLPLVVLRRRERELGEFLPRRRT